MAKTAIVRCEVPLSSHWRAQATRLWPSARREGPIDSGDISVAAETLLVEMSTNELPLVPMPRLGLPAPEVGAAVEVAALIADRSRAGVLRLLATGPHCVCEMAAALGERQNNVSNHLARLREAGLVRASRHGLDARWVYYERDEEAISRAAAVLREVLG